MWILALEAFVALSLLVLIVWLTMGGRRKEDRPAPETDKPASKSDEPRS